MIKIILLCVPIIGLYGEWQTSTCHLQSDPSKIWIYPSNFAAPLGTVCYWPDDSPGYFI